MAHTSSPPMLQGLGLRAGIPRSTARSACARAQRGVTLIGLMVGLLITSIVVLSTFILYRTIVHITVDSTESARRDADLMSGMLAANMRLQGAGFGVVDAAYGTHLLVIKNATIPKNGGGMSGSAQSATPPIEGNAVVWSSTDLDGSNLCEALVPTPTDSGQSATGMSYTYASPCSGVAQWQSLPWKAPSPIIVKAKVDVAVKPTACKPFGIEQGPGGIQLTLYALDSMQLASYADANHPLDEPTPLEATSTGVSKNSVCLANFPSPQTPPTGNAQ